MLGSVAGQSEAAGRVELQEETQDTILELNPAHEGPAPHCSAAGMGVCGVRNDSSASCSPVKMTRSCQINIITIRV